MIIEFEMMLKAPCLPHIFVGTRRSLIALRLWWRLGSTPATHVHALLTQDIVAERDAPITDIGSVLTCDELLDLRFGLAAERT